MNWLDWTIVVVYLSGLMVMSYLLGRRQKDSKDYYLAGNDMGPLPIALSTAATQCSTNSLLGAPAFVALGAGLMWLQYEMAVPLAMIVCILLIYPIFRKRNLTSVYEYLEQRYDENARFAVALLFMFFRAISTGVTLYGVSLALMFAIGVPFYVAVICIGIATVAYDAMGGLKAVIWSDVIQFVLLVLAVIVAIILCLIELDGWSNVWAIFPQDKSQALFFGDSERPELAKYEFWTMLIGGFFIYLSYYGCDQTQAQRELSSRSVPDTQKALFYDGLIRFPLVLLYCFLGVCIGAYMVLHPEIIDMLYIDTKTGLLDPTVERQDNLAVPTIVFELFPHGAIGLVVVGLFAAAMSSLDSTINSLSAVTTTDVLPRIKKKKILKREQLFYSRIATVVWGIVIVASSFLFMYTGTNIIEMINKVGSLYNGPLLAVFLMGMLTTRVSSKAMLIGFILGILLNLIFFFELIPFLVNYFFEWEVQPIVFWWWNLIGFANSCVIALFASRYYPRYVNTYQEYEPLSPNSIFYAVCLAAYFLFILVVLFLI